MRGKLELPSNHELASNSARSRVRDGLRGAPLGTRTCAPALKEAVRHMTIASH
jgi:hypothetical protein